MAEDVVRVPVCLQHISGYHLQFVSENIYLDSQQLVIVLPPVSGHPVTAVTAGPVAVLAVGHVVLLQLVFHAFLNSKDQFIEM